MDFEKLIDSFEFAAITRFQSLKREGRVVTVDIEADEKYQRLRTELLHALNAETHPCNSQDT